MPVSILNQIQEECDINGITSSKMIISLLRIGLSERMAERAREDESPKEIVIKECSAELSEKEQAQMDKLLSAEPSEDHERNQVAFKRQES